MRKGPRRELKKLYDMVSLLGKILGARDAEISDLRKMVDDLESEVLAVKVAGFDTLVGRY